MLQERFIWMMHRNGVPNVHQGIHADVTATLIEGVTLEHNSDPVDEVELIIDNKRFLIKSDELLKEVMNIFKSHGSKTSYLEYAEKKL